MQIKPLNIDGAFEITLAPRGDVRGYFMRAYDRQIFKDNGLVTEWVQENQSYSAEINTVRGLHFQTPPHGETKLVRAVQGEVLDVFVDIRKSSSTYGKWCAVKLSSTAHNMVYIPKGCAHGYRTLTKDSVVLYKVDSVYAQGAEGGLRYDDPALGVDWGIEKGTAVIQSDKDKLWPLWDAFKTPF